MIPAYPTDNKVTVQLGKGVTVNLQDVDFIMWMDADGVAQDSNDDDKDYTSFSNAEVWVVVLKNDEMIRVWVANLDSDTQQHLTQVAFPS